MFYYQLHGVLPAETACKIDTNADNLLESVTGRAYTEPAMFTRTDGLEVLLSRKISSQLNGRGKNVHLESVSGNVNVRHVD